MKSYNNDPKLKKRFIEEIKKHQEADAIQQGHYGRKNGTWKGCAVACSLRSLDIIDGKELHEEYNQHKQYETKIGPEWLAHLEDTLFEEMKAEDANKFPLQFAEAIPVGVDLEPVKWKFCAYLMKENIERVTSFDIDDEPKKQIIDAIRDVLAVHEKAIKTGEWDKSAAERAEVRAVKIVAECAASVAWSAWSAASAASAWGATAIAMCASESAWGAAFSAESAENAERARMAASKKHADKLLELLREAK